MSIVAKSVIVSVEHNIMKSGTSLLRLRQRILFGKAIAIGPGKAELLERIIDTGSISAASRQMGMSYRRAWLLVDTMNQCFSSPLIETAAGGSGGGGARITPLGEQQSPLIGRYSSWVDDPAIWPYSSRYIQLDIT